MTRKLFLGSVLVLGLAAVGSCGDSSTGRVSATWMLTTASGNTQLTCDDELADTVTIHVTGSGLDDTELFDCTDYSGTTGKIATGTYTVTLSISDASGAAIQDSVAFTNVVVLSDQTTSVGNVQWRF